MTKFMLILLPILTLAFFVLVMNSSFMFLHPGGYDVDRAIELAKGGVSRGDWEYVSSSAAEMKNVIINKVLPCVQFSMERSELDEVRFSLARIEGSIAARDKSAALVNLFELQGHWDNLSS